MAAAIAPSAADAQVPFGTMYAGRSGEVREISKGGNTASGFPFAYGLDSVIAVCVGPGRRLYAAEVNPSQVSDITAGDSPVVPPYIDTGCSPAALVCDDNEILVGCYSGEIYEATAGGNLSGTVPFAKGIKDLHALFRDSKGKLWAGTHDSLGNSRVLDVTAGGDFTNAVPLATSTEYLWGLTEHNGVLLATLLWGDRIVEFAGGGDLLNAPVFASGINGPTDIVDAGGFGLYVHSTDQNGTIYEVSAGGNQAGAPAFAYGFALVGQIPLTYVGGCGDGYLQGKESCDEAAETAGCDGDCTPVACGDGHLNKAAGEECDDGNKLSGDGCSSVCASEGAGGSGGSGGSGVGGGAQGGGSGVGGSAQGGAGGAGGAGGGGNEGGAGGDGSGGSGRSSSKGGCTCSMPDPESGATGWIWALALGALGRLRRGKGYDRRARRAAPLQYKAKSSLAFAYAIKA